MGRVKVNDESYFQISGWMLNRLKLKGTDLQIYALIYGFSQDGESEFTGSLQYLCEFTGTSKPTVIKSLKALCEKEYIIKREKNMYGVVFNRYKANLQVVKELYSDSKETFTGSKETLPTGSKETLPNNISLDNIDNNIDNIKESKSAKRNSFDTIISEYTQDEKTIDLLTEWLKVRKAKRAAMTDRAIQMNIKKLDSLAHASGMTVNAYLEEVICRGWAAFYEIKQYGNNGKKYGATGVAVKAPEEDDVLKGIL